MVLDDVLKDVSKCAFCGFCEWVCPTIIASDNLRHYGPRGRVNLIYMALKDGVITQKTIEGIYTCLLCRACEPQCPAGIKIASDIREFREYLIEKVNSGA